jgi:hypothetical protein
MRQGCLKPHQTVFQLYIISLEKAVPMDSLSLSQGDDQYE